MKHMRANTRSGFSLVEVTLAVAIASVAMITFLGLLPLGLDTSRKTSTKLANCNILEQVVQNLDGQLWSTLPKPTTKQYLYFNEEGTQVTAGSLDMTYMVELEYAGPASLPQDSGTQTYLQRAYIRIANTNSSSFKFPSANGGTAQMNGSNFTTYSYLFAKTR